MTRAQSVVARTFATTPARAATETWEQIVNLIASSTEARRELAAVAGVVCAMITEEALRDDPLTLYGAGPRVRIYAVYGDDAISGEGVREDPLSFDPTDGDWRMSLPCPAQDLAWVERSLARVSTRVRARALGEAVSGEDDDSDRSSSGSTVSKQGAPVIDRNAFLRP